MDNSKNHKNSLDQMTANMYVVSNLSFLSPEQTVFDAYQEMQKRRVHHLPVIQDGKAVGVISDRDLMFVRQYGDHKDTLCRDVMSENPICVTTSEQIVSVAQKMVENKINSVLINNSEGNVVGIFTSTDALKLLTTI